METKTKIKMIQNELEVCQYLNIPSIPKKEWDCKANFKYGVAIVNNVDGRQSYGVVTYNAEKDEKPRIVKIFTMIPFTDIEKVFVVPNYMDTNVEKMDLDEESKKKAEILVKEAKEYEMDGVENAKETKMEDLPEWIFAEINNKEEAQAWLRQYNKINKIKKGKVPSNEETLKLRLYAIYKEQEKRK